MLDMMHSGGVVVVLLKLWCGGVWDLGGGFGVLGCWGVGRCGDVGVLGCYWRFMVVEVMEIELHSCGSTGEFFFQGEP
jgi:hypothetical protein